MQVNATFIQRVLEFTTTEEFQSENLYALQARLQLLEARWKDFKTLNIPLEEINIQTNQCFSTGEDAYIKAKAAVCSQIDSRKTTPIEKGLSDRNVVRQLGDILSQDKLPVFNGDFTQWATFRDFFESKFMKIRISRIHRN